MPEGQASEDCAEALDIGRSPNGAGKIISKALGDGWEIRAQRREGVRTYCWFRIGSDPEGDAIRAWFESMPEGQTGEACTEALGVTYSRQQAGILVSKALGDGWQSRMQKREGVAAKCWFRIGSDQEGDAIRAWFESMPEGQTSEACADAIGMRLSPVAAGVIISKALGKGWEIRRRAREGVKAMCWFRIGSDPRGDAIRAWFESMPEGQTSEACSEALGVRLSTTGAGMIVGKALGDGWEIRRRIREGVKTYRWFRATPATIDGTVNNEGNE